ncbi:MAG: hypothetical protein ACRD1D_12655, partial [Acidimicrobiales bacterium]
WCRRGIVAELNTADTGQALDQRAAVRVGATITNAGPGGVDITVLGPGDVTGLDLRLVVRTQPRPGTDTFEPNHLAAVDFDLPDLPWLVTPARAGSGDGLRPWIALVVVEQQLGVSLGLEAGALLPVLRIESPADARVELPDPGSTDLWAHGQLLADAAIAPSAVPAELEAHPGRNVSRLVCPRRLRAGARYYACVVPAFDAGAVRGLGGMPVEGAPLAPSWGGAAVRLPVYFHWEFSTGPEGDFETLAARLRPHQVSARLGRAPMHVGAAHPGVAELPEGDPAAVIDMDGALRAPSGDDLRLAEVDPRIRSGLRAAANAAARQVSGRNAPLIVGPPVHGSWAVNRHELTDDGPAWLTELNVDPRARVAAGLGADAVRRNQEDLMHAAWVQLADVRAANDRLNAARLSLEVARKAYARHLVPLPADRLVPLASPVHRRTLLGQVTLPEAVRPTSLPDAAMGPALRRLTSARRPLLRAAARHTGRTFTPAVVAMLAPGFEGVDPTRFVPDGIVSMASLEALAVPADPDAAVGLDGLGVAGGTIRAARLHAQRDRARRLAPMAGQEVDVRVRRGAGLVAAGHLAAIEDLPGLGGDERAALARQLVATAGAAEGSEAFLLAVDETDRPTVGALDLAPDGTVTLRARRGRPVVVGRIDVALSNRPGGLPGVLRRLPPGTIDRTGASRFRVRPNPGGGVIVDSAVLNPTLVPRRVPTAVVPPLVADAATRSRFRGAFDPFAGRFRLDAAPERPVAVAFDLTAAAAAVLRRTDPDRTVPARVAEMVRIGGHDIRQPPPGVSVAPTLDRVMAGPSFDVPTYLYLARHDRHRFCPGIDEVPVDSVTLLETNPRFVEAYLVGLNHEMNHELVWRTYPTDQRGTPFTRFWDRLDGRPDVGPIHQFGPGRLGAHLVDAEPQLVLLVRGELLRRYPTAAVYAVRSTAGGEMSTRDEDTLTPIFAGSFEPDIAFVGFDLQEDDLDDGNGWFFVIQEQPTEPRFGLDDPAARPGAEPATWSEAAWSDTGLAPGQHLTPAALAAVGLGALPHAGATAAALFQRPVRVAVHARRLVAPEA